jgi:4-hydroxybenzoate polyprenyltransferase
VAVETLKSRGRAGQTSATLRSVVRAARPVQWTKNLLVFAGLVFSESLADAGRWLEAVLTFVAFCLASSASYLANDVVDAEHDRAHPLKRLRPVASGELAPRAAIAAAVGLAAAALGLAVAVGLDVAGLLIGFLSINLAYSARLKHVVLVDVVAISLLFVIRAGAGALAIDVWLSPWLVVCTGLLALFLALVKRRGELVLVGAAATPGRPVLEGYSLALVDQLVAIVAAATISSYSLYTFTATESEAMMLTIPFVVLGLFRYLFLMHRRELGEEPERILLTDAALLATVGAWIVTAAAILIIVR